MRPNNPCSVCGEDFEPVRLAGVPIKQCMRCFGKFLTRFDPLAYELNDHFGAEPPSNEEFAAARVCRHNAAPVLQALD